MKKALFSLILLAGCYFGPDYLAAQTPVALYGITSNTVTLLSDGPAVQESSTSTKILGR